jgi:hypothetical protein
MAKVKLPEALVKSRAAKARGDDARADGLQGRLDLVHGIIPAQQDCVLLRARVAPARVQQN